MDFEATRCGFSGCYAAIQRQKRAGEHERGRSEALLWPGCQGEETMPMNSDQNRAERGQKRAAALVRNVEAARRRGRTQYNREDYDGSHGEDYAGGQHETEKRRL